MVLVKNSITTFTKQQTKLYAYLNYFTIFLLYHVWLLIVIKGIRPCKDIDLV